MPPRRHGILPHQVLFEKHLSRVKAKRRVGDRGGNPAIRKGPRGALGTLVDGDSRSRTVLQPVRHKMADSVSTAVHCSLVPYKARVHTITDDNGRECAAHAGWR
jgi:IS30 family transposase